MPSQALISAAGTLAFWAAWASAQCVPEWRGEGGNGVPGVGGSLASSHFPAGTVCAATEWDPDGTGPQAPLLIVGGTFSFAGTTPAPGIAAWNGTAWSDLKGGLPPAAWPFSSLVLALTVYEGDLIVGGDFNTLGGAPASYVVRHDGATWHALGDGLPITARALIVHNGELIAAGGHVIAGQSAGYVRRWTGTAWVPIGGTPNNSVLALASHAGALYAGGEFTQVGGVRMARIARWNGNEWQPLGSGADNAVNALLSYNGELIAGGDFQTAGGAPAVRVAKWNGSTWSPLPGMTTATSVGVNTLLPFSGTLIAAGTFRSLNGSTAWGIASWDGAVWASVGTQTWGEFYAAAVYSGELIVGGERFVSAGGAPVAGLARWNGSAWSAAGTGGGNGVPTAFGTWQSSLIAGGPFTQLDGVPAAHFARLAGSSWEPIAPYDSLSNVQRINDIQDFEGDLVVAGSSSVGVRRWNGAAWQLMGTNLDAETRTLEVYGGELIAGGNFGYPGPNGPRCVARWTGTTWQSLGGGVNRPVLALAVFEGKLIAGGTFTTAGAGLTARNIAAWDGANWTPIGEGFGHEGCHVSALAVHEGDLYAAVNLGGCMPSFGSPVARWSDGTWTPVGPGTFELTGHDVALTVHRGEITIGGVLRYPVGIPAPSVMAWNGQSWHPLIATAPPPPYYVPTALASFAGDLWTNAPYTASGTEHHWMSRLGCACYADCTANGALTIADFACFQTQFVQGQPYADCNSDTALTIADFACFQSKFVAGCP